MLLPLVVSLATLKHGFFYLGVDVLVQEQLKLTIAMMPNPIPQSTYLIEGNSLDVLPTLVDREMKFDLVLLDGDHNYYTVSRELPLVTQLVGDDGLLVIDDVFGKWENRDLFYSTRDEYVNVDLATQPVQTIKHGVRPAVSEWLKTHSEWVAHKPIPGEPVLLAMNGVLDMKESIVDV